MINFTLHDCDFPNVNMPVLYATNVHDQGREEARQEDKEGEGANRGR